MSPAADWHSPCLPARPGYNAQGISPVPVAQLDRASASGAEGYRFDSCRGYFPPLLSHCDSTRGVVQLEGHEFVVLAGIVGYELDPVPQQGQHLAQMVRLRLRLEHGCRHLAD